MEPENEPLKKEIPIGNIWKPPFSASMLNFEGVCLPVAAWGRQDIPSRLMQAMPAMLDLPPPSMPVERECLY